MKTLALLGLATFALATTVFARIRPPVTDGAATSEPASSGGSDGKFLTGNWGGVRDGLREYGIEPFIYYTADPATNVTGGKDRSFNYADDVFFGVNVDLDKLAGWRGATFVINGIRRDGSSIRGSIGSQFDPQQTVGGQTTFLYDVTLEQAFLDKKLSVKVGRFGACDDFNNSPIYNLYLNNAIDGDVRNVLFDTQFSAYPFATWAARIRYAPTGDTAVKLGVFQNTDHVFDRLRHGTDWSIGEHDGVFLIGQIGWTPHLFKPAATPDGDAGKDGKTAAAANPGMPGHYHLGASFSPWEGYPQFRRAGKTDNSYGFYAHADQVVYQETPGSEQGLTLWAAAGFYPQQNIAIVPFQLNAGAIYQGLFPTRDQDKAFVGLIYGKFSRDYARVVADQGNGHPNYELVLEADYRYQLTKFAYLQPDVQGVIRPGGTGRISNALVLATQVGITF